MFKKYSIPLTNIGQGYFIKFGAKRYHVPSWIEVGETTTYDDVDFFNPVPKEERNEEKWKFKSSDGKKDYYVKYNYHGALSCSCWGYIAHKKCKHITEVKAGL